MTAKDSVFWMIRGAKKTVRGISAELGISPPTLYKSINGKMTLERYLKIVELTGRAMYVGKPGEDLERITNPRKK